MVFPIIAAFAYPAAARYCVREPSISESTTMLEQIQEDVKTAMKARDKLRLDCLRMLVSEIKNLKISKGGINAELEESDVLSLLQREVKKRTEAAQSYRDAGREETAEKEEAEAAIIKEYLPQELSDEELSGIVDETIAATGAVSKKEMGKVMGAIMAKYKGRVDGKKVQNLVMSKLP